MIKIWIDRLLIGITLLLVLVLAGTTIPWMRTGQLQGNWLLVHMLASGGLVVVLPLLAIYGVWRNLSRVNAGTLQWLGFWVLVIAGMTTMVTIFLCMLPVPSTEQMQDAMVVHGYAGFVMVPAVLLLAVGSRRMRRIQATRSATPG